MHTEKYGFVYIWFDRKHKRYYVGCHWGTETDGYVCSSSWMKQAYKIRPNDFKRRILSRIEDRSKLLEEEYKWLALIRPEELKVRYYNVQNRHFAHWAQDPERRKEISNKISLINKSMPAWNKGKKMPPLSEERKEQNRQWMLKNCPHKGLPRSKETKAKISERNKGMKQPTRSEEFCRAISERKRGIPMSESAKKALSQTQRKNSGFLYYVDGILFETVTDIMKELSLASSTVWGRINSSSFPTWQKVAK